MRDLLISLLTVIVLAGSWLLFDSYSEKEVNDMSATICNEIIPYAESEDWDNCQKVIDTTQAQWVSYKKSAHLFLGAESLYEIDDTFARCIEFANAKDVSNTSGELNSLASRLSFLNSREKITWGNIF